MMFDPANLGQSLQPGDKMTLTFHKGQPKAGGSFLDNAQKAGAIPGGAPMPPAPAAMMPPGPAMPPMAPPMALAGPAPSDRLALIQALQSQMGK